MRLQFLVDAVELVLLGVLPKPVGKLDHAVDLPGHVLARQHAGEHGLSRKQAPGVLRSERERTSFLYGGTTSIVSQKIRPLTTSFPGNGTSFLHGLGQDGD